MVQSSRGRAVAPAEHFLQAPTVSLTDSSTREMLADRYVTDRGLLAGLVGLPMSDEGDLEHHLYISGFYRGLGADSEGWPSVCFR